MCSMKLLILGIFSSFALIFHPANARESAKSEMPAAVNLAIKSCQDGLESTYLQPQDTLCLKGKVEEIFAYVSLISDAKPKVAVISSEGGRIDMAIKLAQWLHRSRAAVVIDGPCLSSCANYLVPVARQLYLTRRAVIAMHGSVPRGKQGYAMSAQVPGTAPDTAAVARRLQEFAAIRQGLLAEETALFDLVLVDDAYLTRYFELARTATVRGKLRTSPSRRITLILDEEYLTAFGIKPIYLGGKPLQDEAIASLGCAFFRDYLLYGFYGDLVREPAKAPANCTRADGSVRIF